MLVRVPWIVFGLVVLVSGVQAASRPNVIIILADDLGWGDLSCYGNKRARTPHLDRLAREGVRFTQFYVASPICSPSRCGLITGQFPARWRITSYLQTRAGNRAAEQADFLDPKAPSLPRTLKAAGYATAHIGKWHLGGGRDVDDAPRFSAYGYDLGLGTYESPERARALGLKFTPWDTRREPDQVARHDRTRWMVDQALAFLNKHVDRPCFINLWLDDIHTPFRPSPDQRAAIKTDETMEIANYLAVLVEMDRQIGRLLDGLREKKRDASTIVVFAGDNGPQPSFERTRTGGLRGMKWSLYEGGIRTPLIARYPGRIPAGLVNETTVLGAVDLFPTVCQLCRVSPPRAVSFDGEDLSSAFLGKKPTRRNPLLWEYGRKPTPAGSKGSGPFPYPREPGAKSPNIAIREGKWKLLVNADGSSPELYDLSSDPNESTNVKDRYEAETRRLTRRALQWRKSLP
jgi:arylsulfatase A-like enzyme